MENVRTARAGSTSQRAAATLEESTPPERKTPNGTSERRCRATAARKSPQNRSDETSKSMGATDGPGGVQYRLDRLFPDSHTRIWARGNFLSDRQIECGAGTYS